MAHSSISTGLQCPVRSISLPSRLEPDCCKVEIELNKLKAWETLSLSNTAPLSSETIQTGLVGIAELYNCVRDLLESPTTQQTLLKQQHRTLIEEALEASVVLLDFCGTIKELFLRLKEQLQDLQSALRRKGGDSSIYNHICAYVSLRKKVKKDATKNLRALKKIENNVESSPVVEDHQLSVLIRLLREVAATTISVFRSLLLFLSVRDSKTKFSGWSLISKLMVARSTTSDRDQKMINEVEFVDISLHSLHENIQGSNSKLHVQMLQRRLQALDANIQGLEAGVDCLFRRLIQSRVSLLNILTY